MVVAFIWTFTLFILRFTIILSFQRGGHFLSFWFLFSHLYRFILSLELRWVFATVLPGSNEPSRLKSFYGLFSCVAVVF